MESVESSSGTARPWRRRIARGLKLVLLVVLLGTAGCVWQLLRFPKTEGTEHVAGLDAKLEILRGPYGVPHVLAATPRDAYFGLGFVEAQDRTFQLEIFRRAASGTLAEILGDGGVQLDTFTRTVGMRRIAESQFKNASPEALALTEAFTAGINAGFHSLRAYPPELTLLGVTPKDWTPLDVMAIARLISYGLAKDHLEAQVLFSKIVAKVGEERARVFLPLSPKSTNDERACLIPVPVLEGGSRLISELGIGVGCSNWLAAGSRTASGKPLFAYDSHQTGARMPGEVYLVHLRGGESLDAAGGVLVGVPGFYSGATREIAFAPTNVAADAADLVVLERDPANPANYLACGQSLPFTRREESFTVKGQAEPRKLQVEETVFGPIVSSAGSVPSPVGLAADPSAAGKARCVALDWVGARPELRLDGYVTMPLAKDWASFRQCLEHFDAAAQHFGFAAADGTIAYQVIGPIARRSVAPAPWPAPPTSLDRAPLLTLDELPHLLNPKDGFVVTANQRPIHADEPFYFGRAFVPSARHDRLVERLETANKADLAFIEETGLDLVSPFARHVTPGLVASLRQASAPDARWLGEKLGSWDFSMKGEAVEPLLYNALWREIARAILEPDLGPELAADYAARPELSLERLAAMLEARADRNALSEKAALAALELISSRLGNDRAGWRWDKLHTVTLESYLHGVTTLLDAGPYGVPGDDDTPYRFGHKTLHEPFKVETVALLRMFVDLGDPSSVDAVVSSGEQGWPLHPHSKDQIPLWLRGRTLRIPRDVDAIRASCPERLVLEPAVDR